jgi:hypothetical protein
MNKRKRAGREMGEKGKRPKKRADLLSEDLGEETVIYDTIGQEVHALNLTAALIWKLCDGCHGLEEIVEEMTNTFDVQPETARKDIAKALEDFQKLGLLA